MQAAFPGGAPDCWLDMTPPVLRAYATMLPRVEADKRRKLIDDLAVGTAVAKQQDRTRHMSELERAANGGKRPKARKATWADLQRMGIKVEKMGTADPGSTVVGTDGR